MIRLSSQTQKTQMASAASYGVGMPTSDGGLGAVSRSLKTVADSSAHIGNVLKTRKAQIQKSVGKRVASRMNQELDKHTADIDTAVELGQWDKVNELRENLNDWLGSVDPNSSNYRAVDKDPELEPNTSDNILGNLRSTHAGYDLKLQSKIAVGQSLSEITNNHEAASDIIKNSNSKLGTGEDIHSGDFSNLVEVHKLAVESPVMQGGSSPVLNKGAAKIRDKHLTDFIDLFVMGQSRSGNIHNTKASIDSLFAQLDENKDLYGEDALKYATKNLLKMQKEIGKPDSAAVSALNSKYHEAANMMSNGSTPTSEYRNNLSNLSAQLIDVDEPKARFVHLFSKLGAPDIISEMISWIRNNPESSPIEYFNDSELLKGFYNKGSFDSSQLTKLANYVQKVGEKANENQAKFGDWGQILTEQPDILKSAPQQAKLLLSDLVFVREGWLDETYKQSPTPVGKDRTVFEGSHLINQMITEDSTAEDIIKVSNMFTNFWGPDKMTDFASYAQGLDNEDFQFVGLVAEAQRRSVADPTILVDRLKLGMETSSESGLKKLLGPLWSGKSSLFSESIRDIFNYETSYSFAKQVTDAADEGGLRSTSLFLQSYVRGVAAQHILANPTSRPEEVSRVVDKILAQDMTVVRDSFGESQVIWNKTNDQSYIGAPWNYLDFLNNGRLTKEEHADVRFYNALNLIESKGVDIVDLLSTYDKNLEIHPSEETTAFLMVKRSYDDVIEKLKEYVSPEDRFKFLTTGNISGKKILRLNPMVMSQGSSDVRSIQIWNSKYNQYQNLTDQYNAVVYVGENELEALSTNEKVQEMNFINSWEPDLKRDKSIRYTRKDKMELHSKWRKDLSVSDIWMMQHLNL